MLSVVPTNVAPPALRGPEWTATRFATMFGGSERCSTCLHLVRFKFAANPSYLSARRFGHPTQEPRFLREFEPHDCRPPQTAKERFGRYLAILCGL